MSLFLFIIMVEGLSHSIQTSIENHSLAILPFHGIDPPISHIQFVDDTIMMGSPTVQEAPKILSIVQTLCDASGMDINKEKSHIFFFNTSMLIQLHITAILGFTRSSLLPKYLGIPLLDKALRNNSCESLLTYFLKRLASWTYRALSLPSCLILLKFTLQALPIYTFSALATPIFFLNAIRTL